MSEKKQLKLWLPEEKITRVEEVAAEWGYKNANAVMEAMIDSYLEFFIAAEEAREAEIERQKKALFKGGVKTEKRQAG